MLRPSGQLVLIDFGAVRQVTTTILAGNSHTRIISQGYSPPEQQNGYSVQQSDFFALGRTFIFLLTGKEPQDKEIYDPLTNELHWRKCALNISPLLADLIDHLMAPTANHRPQNPPYSCMGMWIYGNDQKNQEMLLFKQLADPILKKYSHNLTETEPKNLYEAYKYLTQQANNNYSKPKNLAVEVFQWIYDTKSISERENLNEVFSEIESLKIRLGDFKYLKPF